MRNSRINALLFIAACTLSTGASAHIGHETSSLMAGLTHPLGADHLLAMLAVGVWSVRAFPAHQVWQGPATFMLALVVSALAGSLGVTMPFLEHAIALSVVVFGAMLAMSTRPFPAHAGLVLIAIAASLHGLAHGAEAPGGGFTGYALGFIAATAMLHLGGVGLGLGMQRWLTRYRDTALGGLGALLGLAGVFLTSQV